MDALQPGERDQFVCDTELPGFGCKVTPKGGKVYVLQDGRNGRDRRLTVGRHGVDVTAEQARLEAQRLNGLIAAGVDLADNSRSRAKRATTVAELGKRYLDEYATQHKMPSGAAQNRRNLDNHIVPLTGSLTVKSVERSDVFRVMREIALGKTAKDEKTRETATPHRPRQ